MYQNLYTDQKKIPVPIALLVVFSILALPIMFKRSTISSNLKQSKPELIQAVNVSHNSATIIWRSEGERVGKLYFSSKESAIGERGIDDRDADNHAKARQMHFVTLKQLQPTTVYFIRLAGDGGFLSRLARGPDLKFETAAKPPETTKQAPLYGTVVDNKGSPQADVIVLVSVKKAGILGAYTKSDGTFLVPLCCLLNPQTGTSLALAREDLVEISLLGNEGLMSQATVLAGETSPLPRALVLGSSVNLIAQTQEETAVLAAQDTNKKKAKIYAPVDIFYPEDTAVIPGVKPLFKGRAAKNSAVILTIQSTRKVINVTTDADGIWSVVPDFVLEPGTHTLTVEAKDESGKKVRLTRKFTIAKSGESVLGEATPEATLAPSGKPSITVRPTNEPTIVAPTLFPTEIPQPTLPESGINFANFSLASMALIMLGVGLILVF